MQLGPEDSESRNESDDENDFAHVGEQLVVCLWLAGAAVTAATAAIHASSWLLG